MKLNSEQIERLKDFYMWVTFSEDSFCNHILGICLEENKIGLSGLITQKIEEQEYKNISTFGGGLIFIESLNLEDITLNKRTLEEITC